MKVENKTINENLETWKKSKKELSENTKIVRTKEPLILKETKNNASLSETTLYKDFKDLWKLKENTYTFKCKGRKELRQLISECKEKNIRYKFEKTLDETYRYEFSCKVKPLKESQAQEIRATYEELAKMNNMEFNDFDKLVSDFLKETNNEGCGIDPIYSARLWSQFKHWAKDTRDLAIKDYSDKKDDFLESKEEEQVAPKLKESFLNEKYTTFPEEYQNSFETKMDELGWVLDNETSRYGAKNFYDDFLGDDGAQTIHYQFITKDKMSKDEFHTLMDTTFDFIESLQDDYGTYATFSAGLIGDDSEYDGRGTIGLDIHAIEVGEEGEDAPVKDKVGNTLYLKDKQPVRQKDKDLLNDISKKMDISPDDITKSLGESRVTDKLKLRRHKKFESKMEEPVKEEEPIKEEPVTEEPKKEESLEENLQLIGKLDDFTPSEKAKPLWDLIVAKDLVGDLNKLLGDLYPSGTPIQDFDDLLVYSPDFIKKMLDITDEDEVVEEPVEEPQEDEVVSEEETEVVDDDDDISMIDRLDIESGVAPVSEQEIPSNKVIPPSPDAKEQYLSSDTGYDENDDDMSALDAVLSLPDEEE